MNRFYLENVKMPIHTCTFFEMFGSYMNHFLLMRTNSDDRWSICVDAHACVFLNFLHAPNTQNSEARLKYDLQHALIMEETHLFDFNIHLYLKLSTKCSNIKSTSKKISALSVNSQKTLKWLFTVDCQ